MRTLRNKTTYGRNRQGPIGQACHVRACAMCGASLTRLGAVAWIDDEVGRLCVTSLRRLQRRRRARRCPPLTYVSGGEDALHDDAPEMRPASCPVVVRLFTRGPSPCSICSVEHT
eukprot:scaffold9128_cov126-Isochrysis_galbana.AAC.4